MNINLKILDFAMQLDLSDAACVVRLHHRFSGARDHWHEFVAAADARVIDDDVHSQWRCVWHGDDARCILVIDSTHLRASLQRMKWQRDADAELHLNAFDNLYAPFYMIVRVKCGVVVRVLIQIDVVSRYAMASSSTTTTTTARGVSSTPRTT